MNYLDAIKKVLEHEGGYVNNPLDAGKRTNRGVTQATYERFIGRKLVGPDIDASAGQPKAEAETVMRNLSEGNAIQIYKSMYWDAMQGDKIKQYAIAAIIFDQAINRGVSAAVKQAQRILGLAQDGKMGPITLAAINGVKDTDFIPKYLTESINAYKTIVANNPSQSVFLTGWLKRVESLRSYASNLFGSINATTVGIGVVAVVGASVLGYIIYQYMTNAPRMA
jgi:lysozyme family protein